MGVLNLNPIPESYRMAVFALLLLVLAAMTIFIFLQNSDAKIQSESNKEGYTPTNVKPLRWEYEEQIDDPNYKMSNTEMKNGYYIVSKIIQDGPNSVAKLFKVKIPYGYYRVNDKEMAQIPYGFILEEQGDKLNVDYTKRIIPKTATSQGYRAYDDKNKPFDPIPANGEIPEGMYMRDDGNTMTALPPGMKPNVKSLEIEGKIHSPKLVKTYSPGYVPDSEYYVKKYPLNLLPFKTQQNATGNTLLKIVVPLPPEIYYSEGPTQDQLQTDTTLNVQFMPYGKIGKMVKVNGKDEQTTGYTSNPSLISKTGQFDYHADYATIQNDYDVKFHDSVDEIKSQSDIYDLSFGSITVLDQTGNLVVLPRSQVQGDITFHRPDAYTFGASTYVPKYEDSVYLSRTSHMPTISEYRSAFKTFGFCEENQGSPLLLEEKCNALSAETCASTACCVLLGGAKCVAGNETGPKMKQNYGDLFVRNKDYYTHMGKCYGNC